MRILRLGPLIATLLFLALGAGFLVAEAREPSAEPEGPPPEVTWTEPRITGTVTQSTTFTATATVSPTVGSVECVVRPKKFADDAVQCAVITGTNGLTVTLTVTPTEGIHGSAFNFQVFLRVKGEERVLAPPLQVRLTRGDEDGDTSGIRNGKGDDDDAGSQSDRSGGSHRPEFSPPGPPAWAGDKDGPRSRDQSSDHGGARGRRGR